MPRYIDADLFERKMNYILKTYVQSPTLTKKFKDALESVPTADVVPKSEVDQLKKALEAQDAEYSQALHDKAREYNMVVDKICLEHRAEYARLHEAHQEELAKAKREVARKIFADMELLIDKYSLEPNYLLLHLKKDIAEFKKQHNKN